MAVIKGRITVDSVLVINTDTDPTTGGGTPAPIGSIALCSDGSGTFTKVGALDIDWTLSEGSGYVAVTANYLVLAGDFTIDCTANTFTVTLPTAIGRKGKCYNIINSGSGTITIATTGGQVIGNYQPQTTLVLFAGEVANVQSDNANWKLYA